MEIPLYGAFDVGWGLRSQGIRFDGSLISTSRNPGARRGCLKFPCGGDDPTRTCCFLHPIQSGCDGNASCLPRPDREPMSLLESPPIHPVHR